MKFLFDILKNEADYKRLSEAVENGNLPLAATGLSGVHKALITAALVKDNKRKVLLVTHDEATAVSLYDDLNSLGTQTLLFNARDFNLSRVTTYSKEYEHKRVNTLSRVLGGGFSVLVTSIEAATQYTLPPEVLRQNIIELRVGGAIDHEHFIKSLVSAGYTRSETTEGVGQFSVRGGIIDVFPTGSETAARIELWGDEIDTISAFDTISQRRTENLESIKIYPANELPFNPTDLIEKLEEYIKKTKKLSEECKAQIVKDINALQNGLGFSPDPYINFIYPDTATLFDYCKDCLIVACDSGNINERIKGITKLESEDIKQLLGAGAVSPKITLRPTAAQISNLFSSSVYLENFPRASYEIPLVEYITFNFKRSSAWSGNITALCEDVSFITNLKGTAVILAGEKRAARVLTNELCEKGINAVYLEKADSFDRPGVYVITGGLSSGFEIPSLKFMLITHRHIAKESKVYRKRPKDSKQITSLDELKQGDYVVHASHGIGVFDGISRITNAGVTKDYIKIKYAGTDVLYVPATQLDLVSKYIGAATEEGSIKLNRLGTAEWQKTRSRVKAAVKDMAKQLTKLYAQRMATKGYAFSEDTDLQSGFESKFEYEETEDQLRCIEEIKRDMQSSVPMERLLCGDVGFGKTEVALRAAFKCVSEGKQCAFLVPTTILAMQHFNTVIRRFGDMPLRVRLLNRFVPKSEQQKTIAGLKSGRIDMVVGTHRLISKDVSFKDIGLVIIDEEQRFGVAQKERLKELYPHVDILTLSATPIPRTLNMAMSGLRDMSSIDEAPSDRHPVQTYVLEQNRTVIIDAINRELRRGGQVYYLHNRVESIATVAARLKEDLPQARIGIAHGKMSEDELSDVWQKLLDQEIDILVCTTIIETGVDVPNANTLIIENADRMGLSQLHQLRGRVGRSPRRAYAYFCFKQNRELSEVAFKRLEAIRQFTEFGSGFKIALRDLEIRGAGSILGGEQHGNMEAVGYDMYLKLLAQAVNEENGIETKEETVCTVDLNISAHIPERYIQSLSARLGIYKRIADIKDIGDAEDVTDELCDRFGEPPKAVMGLIEIALLRAGAAKSGITEITQTAEAVHLHTAKIDEEVASKLAAQFCESFAISAVGSPQYVIKLGKKKVGEVVSKLAKVL